VPAVAELQQTPAPVWSGSRRCHRHDLSAVLTAATTFVSPLDLALLPRPRGKCNRGKWRSSAPPIPRRPPIFGRVTGRLRPIAQAEEPGTPFRTLSCAVADLARALTGGRPLGPGFGSDAWARLTGFAPSASAGWAGTISKRTQEIYRSLLWRPAEQWRSAHGIIIRRRR
jgi:hypothetical protein